ncbi:BTB domain transcription factor, partial [Metarhizium majus ARSEF 297]
MAAKHPADSCVILEAGVFSLLIRARVGTDTSDQVNDINSIARSYILLQPIARAEQPVKKTLSNKNAARVLILPKKALPSKGERFMAFVAKANASDDDVKDELTTSADYETKTAGIHHTPAATKVCEGTYTLSSAGGRTHLVYVITQPETLSKFLREHLKVQVRGSFLISTRNPTYEGPANVQLPVGPEFPEEILSDFRSLRWIPSTPDHLDYTNAQFLLIGEKSVVEEDGESEDVDHELEIKIEDVDMV